MTASYFDFDQRIERSGTDCEKYDMREHYFGRGDVIPLWVADMDFAAPPAVLAALLHRAEHPVFGYSFYPVALYDSVVQWLADRHGWQIDPEWIVMAPGVVPSLHAAVYAYTQPGDGVIVQPPIYPPFFNAATATGRTLLLNPLQYHDGGYGIDWDHLEKCMQQNGKLLLLCSPHNPVGRVWRNDELSQLLALAARYQVMVVSDEIHADLIYPGERHWPTALLAEHAHQVITAISPSKTFNIPGLGLSCLIIPDSAQRQTMRNVFASWRVGQANPFSVAAFQAAFQHGAAWLDALLPYLANNRDFVAQRLANIAPQLKVTPSQGTYLLWLNCQALAMSDQMLRDFFVTQAGLGLNPGVSFGDVGTGYMRMNIGTPRAILAQALNQLATAFGKLAESRP